MKRKASVKSSFISFLLITAILISSLPTPVFAQEKPVVISIGQPNIWSLEQAHYLLARMHRQNLDLQTKSLGDLDPNEVNSQSISIVRQLISAGFKFDEAVRVNNELLKSDKTFNSGRRQELLTQRSTLQAQKTQVSREITALKIAKSKATDDAEKAALQEQIDAKTEEKAAIEDELENVNGELSGLTSASGDFKSVDGSTEGFDSTKIPKSTELDALIPNTRANPSIAASQRLENYVGMQYEIIAKQLTLLRDEVGPGERLVFLELPQSINLSQDQEKNKYYQALRGIAGMSTNDSADNKMAQVWWRIAGYTRVDKGMLLEQELAKIVKELEKIEDEIKYIQYQTESVGNLGNELRTLTESRIVAQDNWETAKIRFSTRKERLTQLQKITLENRTAVNKQELKTLEEEEQKLKSSRIELSGIEAKITKVKIAISLREKETQLEAELKKLCEKEAERQAELKKSEEQIEAIEAQIAAIRDIDPKKLSQAAIRRNERRISRLENQIEELEKIDCARISNDLALLSSTIKQTRVALQLIKDHQLKLDKERARLIQGMTALYTKYEKLRLQVESNKIREQRNDADRLLQGGGQSTASVVTNTISLLNQNTESFLKINDGNVKETDGRQYMFKDTENGREYISLIENYTAEKARLSNETPGVAFLRNRAVRVIDIIPRQNAINVDTTKESVKATGIVGAFSFLFGFGGNVRYQRQKEQFDAFLNQELYTSGFGKGQTDFGWSFFPFSGTKQLAPGVRTTYAVAIIPENAESVVLRAKGCYFPRREKQPLDYNATVDWKNGESSSCFQEQVFILPVPGGAGQGADFYINEIRYSPNRGNGERMVASVYGENISPQTGVTVDGVPLREAVGLAQTNIESILGDKIKEICDGSICGRFERVSTNQLVISFKMPDGYKGTPKITLVAPGKAIEINNLYLNVNGSDETKLDEADLMFGRRPSEAPRSINDFKVAPDPTNAANTPVPQMIGVVTGKYEVGDSFYVNGSLATIDNGSCKTNNLCIIRFPIQKTDFLTVTIVPGNKTQEAISKTFVNPSQLKIINATVARFKKSANNAPAVLTVKIDGSGFSSAVIPTVNAPASIDLEKTLITSSGQMVVEIISPTPVVNITLTDKNTNNSVSTVVMTPPE
jgi:hypothetical protein